MDQKRNISTVNTKKRKKEKKKPVHSVHTEAELQHKQEISAWDVVQKRRPAGSGSFEAKQPAVSVACFRARSWVEMDWSNLARVPTFWIELPRPSKLDMKHVGNIGQL